MDVRMLVRRVILGWVILVVIVALLGKVTVAETNAGRTAADFLLIGQGARAAGMGGAFTAVSDGSLASYWNPAGLTGLENSEALLSHFAWYQDISLEYGVFAHRVSDAATVAASVTLLSIFLMSDGFSSKKLLSFSFARFSTKPFTSLFPSLLLVCPSNWASRNLTLITAVSPSRTSSPVNLTFLL